ncbi:SusD/RagB family nutrient-binding outer membrane lipoprotein, partial [Flagellimonas beolgyonensis]|uniref:SusD/RagB family nutrient-binding outer membrane lipoprotein n=1 Tax=Flagellimonas beolgyonensis TaxID=864064 RepID=UPI003D658334
RTYSSGTNIPGAGVQAGMFTNVSTLEAINEASDIDYSFHLGVSKALQAHMLMLLVDYLGETAWSQAGNPDEFPAPALDDGASVYAAALGLLDEAQSLLSGSPLTLGATDLFYDGDTSKWLKLINTIRLKAYA